jgi:hypothetical protein
MTRYLRIAGAVAFALLACALIGLWIRSHFYLDQLTYLHDRSIWFGASSQNQVTMGRELLLMPDDGDRLRLLTISQERLNTAGNRPSTFFGFGYRTQAPSGSASLTLPHWFLAGCAAAVAALLAFKRFRQFTVREALFATTVVALLLGSVVYFLQRL